MLGQKHVRTHVFFDFLDELRIARYFAAAKPPQFCEQGRCVSNSFANEASAFPPCSASDPPHQSMTHLALGALTAGRSRHVVGPACTYRATTRPHRSSRQSPLSLQCPYSLRTRTNLSLRCCDPRSVSCWSGLKGWSEHR